MSCRTPNPSDSDIQASDPALRRAALRSGGDMRSSPSRSPLGARAPKGYDDTDEDDDSSRERSRVQSPTDSDIGTGLGPSPREVSADLRRRAEDKRSGLEAEASSVYGQAQPLRVLEMPILLVFV